MVPFSILNPLIQAIAALLIFVIGYFFLLFSVIVCLLLVALLTKAARLLWSYAAKNAAPAPRAGTRLAGDVHSAARRIAALIHPLAAPQRSHP